MDAEDRNAARRTGDTARDDARRDPLISARRDPAWLNPASLKGAALVLVGSAILVSPQNRTWTKPAVGALLIVWALVEVWFGVVRDREGAQRGDLVKAAVAMCVGILLITPLDVALTILIGIALIGRGIVQLVEARRLGDAPGRRPKARGALILVALGCVTLAVPETAALTLRLVIGTAALGIGGILLASGLRPASSHTKKRADLLRELDTQSAPHLAEDWLMSQRLPDARVEDLADGLYFEAPGAGAKRASFWIMMLLATAIAAFAVIQDSTAVVIGAMLVAPLMTPIMGAAAAIVNGWPTRLAASLLTVLAAVAAAIALSWLVAGWLPTVGDLATNSQIVSRTSPSLLDLCIAVVAGAAGAYASVDPRVSSSLSGVAIAVALVPPLAVVGITLEAGNYGDAVGAFLLFGTNFVSIVLVSIVVFVLTGFAEIPRDPAHAGQMRHVVQTVLLGAVLIVVPLSLTSATVWSNATNTADAESAVATWLGDTDLSVSQLKVDGADVDVVITGSDEPPPVEDLSAALEQGFGEPVDLTVRLVPSQLLVQPD